MARPASPDPKSEFVPTRWTVGEHADLERYAQLWGLSRSAFVRECVRRVIASERRKAAKLRGRADV